MSIYEQINANKYKTYLVMAFFIAFISFMAYVFGQANGSGLSFAGVALIISGLISLGSYYFSDSIVLSLSG
ncbi:zinc metalloprotease HtpX, partial [Candidatus Gottesmanbacteria bacterium]|nr:zinc metalloprotease HtpX [Candidatus Gottesmanbacteria bacterium]